MAKKKFPKRKRRFSLLTKEGQELQSMDMKIKNAIPDPKERLNYIKSLITFFEKEEINTEHPDQQKFISMGVGNDANLKMKGPKNG